MEPDQTVGPRMIAYYERLAKGGVGFLVVESCGVEYPLGIQHVHYSPTAATKGVQLHFDDDRFIPSFQRLTEAVHKQGCPVSIQFQHAGPWNPTGLLPRDMKIRDIKCASAMTQEELPGPDFLPCRAMTKQEVEDQIDLWASAAERACKAGFDACEINHATAHQGNTFLSRIWNKREDEYGPQSYENRTRFIREHHRRGQAALRPRLRRARAHQRRRVQPPAGHHPRRGRRDGQAHLRGGRRPQRAGRALRAPRRHPAARPPDVPGAALRPARGPRLEPQGRRGDGAAGRGGQTQGRQGAGVDGLPHRRRDGRGVPAQRQPRLRGHDPAPAGRPGVSQQDPRGRLEDVRPCLGCLHCFEMRNRNKKLECRVNATLGREIMPEYQATPAERRKKVLVVGGGPAGMEAARVAAERGHEVALYEKDARLGGLVPLAAIVKDCETPELLDFVRYQERELRKNKVAVHKGTEVTPEIVRRRSPTP